MAVSKRNPNTILLGGGLPGGDGGHTIDNEIVAGVVITPGMIIELYTDTDKAKWRPHASAAEMVSVVVALEKSLHNKTIDDTYAINDLVLAAHLRHGSEFYALVPSGQDISSGEFMQSNGDGKLKTASATTAAANVARFQARETIGAVTADTRCRVVVV